MVQVNTRRGEDVFWGVCMGWGRGKKEKRDDRRGKRRKVNLKSEGREEEEKDIKRYLKVRQLLQREMF
jgi:hypothetical protein